MRRVLDIARIQAVNWPSTLGWPLGILGIAFAANLVISGAIGDGAQSNGEGTGGLVSIYIVMLIAHLQTMTQYFPFAMGLSVTRRAFFWGSAVVIGLQAVVFGTALTVLQAVESASDGWGIGLEFFGPAFMDQGNVLAQWAVFTVPFLALSAIGFFLGMVLKRWGQTGLYVTTITSAALLALTITLISWRGAWLAVGDFFADTPTVALVAGYPLLVAVALGAAAYAGIRRATP
jgi:hypothetical protein